MKDRFKKEKDDRFLEINKKIHKTQTDLQNQDKKEKIIAAANDKVGKGNIICEVINGKMTIKKVDNGRPNKSMTQNVGNTTMNSFNDRDISNNSFVSNGTRLGPSKSLAVLEMMKHNQLPSMTDTIKPRA